MFDFFCRAASYVRDLKPKIAINDRGDVPELHFSFCTQAKSAFRKKIGGFSFIFQEKNLHLHAVLGYKPTFGKQNIEFCK